MQGPEEIGSVGPHEMVFAERRDSERIVYFCAWCGFETPRKFMLQHYDCEQDQYKDKDRYSVD